MTQTIEKDYDIGYAVIHATQFGKGKPLLLLPGWPYGSSIFLTLKPFIENEYSVTAIDLPCWSGESSFIESKPVKVNMYVQIIQDMIEILYPDNNAINICGISLGGTLSLLAAQSLNTRVNKIIAQSPPYNLQEILDTHRVESTLLNYSKKYSKILDLVKTGYVSREILFNGPRIIKTVFMGPRHDYDIMLKLIREYGLLDIKQATELLHDLIQSEFQKELTSTQCPVVIVGCSDDKLVTAESCQRLSENVLPNSKYREVNGARHRLILDDAEKFSDLILENI